MAQVPILEYHAKKILYRELAKYLPKFPDVYTGVLVDGNNLEHFKKNPPFASGEKLVVKPDQLFGKRGKNNLLAVNVSWDDAVKWIAKRMNKEVTVKKNETDEGITGILTHFLVEPFVKNSCEYYLAMKTGREYDEIFFSEAGGINVEENWDKVKTMHVEFVLENKKDFKVYCDKVAINLRLDTNSFLVHFITATYLIFKDLSFTYLEFNPFALDSMGIPIPLDAVARVDSTAQYLMEKAWKVDSLSIEFPQQFGTFTNEIESKVEELDAKSGASLKLSILNPDGRIWLLTAGGGASVIFADTVADLGYGELLGNYGEYSGNPSANETESYCDMLFEAMFKSKAKDKTLIIGGGIANFTDVASTFVGIIKSIEKNKETFRHQKIRIFVRRGGPRYKEGLAMMKQKLEAMGISASVNGPEMHMTRIIKEALG